MAAASQAGVGTPRITPRPGGGGVQASASNANLSPPQLRPMATAANLTSVLLDQRHRWLAAKVQQSLGVHDANIVINYLSQQAAFESVRDFFHENGTRMLLVYYQPPQEGYESQAIKMGPKFTELRLDVSMSLAGEIDDKHHQPNFELHMGDGRGQKLVAKSVCFIRATPRAVAIETVDKDIFVCELSASPLEAIQSLLAEVYFPILKAQDSWGNATSENVEDFLAIFSNCVSTLTEAMHSLQFGIQLREVDANYRIENTQAAWYQAANDFALVGHYESVVSDWSASITRILDEAVDAKDIKEDIGPNTEYEFWRGREAQLHGVVEHFKSAEHKTVMGVLTACRSNTPKTFTKNVEARVTDALNEAKDNAKFMDTLRKFLDPLYIGTPATIIETLPGLLNQIKIIHQVAHFFNSQTRMTNLFKKITNQMIMNCKQTVNKGGRLWDQKPQVLIPKLKSCIALHHAFQKEYRLVKQKVTSSLTRAGRERPFEFNESECFGKMTLFCKRIEKLVDMFSTVGQFKALQESSFEGMSELIRRFNTITYDLRRRQYDILDYSNNRFDKDYIEFIRHVEELEGQLMRFVESTFQSAATVSDAFRVLERFHSIFLHDKLKVELNAKYLMIFKKFGGTIEDIQAMYLHHRARPPVPRGMPPVAGSVMWARQLIDRIEMPMKQFQFNQIVMKSRDARKIVKHYNKVARSIIEYETLWIALWQQNVDAARAGLSSTLAVRHPETGQLFVNFDRDIWQLIQETRALVRMNVDVPQKAKIVLMQEEKLKTYYFELRFVVSEYTRILSKVTQDTSGLVSTHFRDLESVLMPSLTTLTWSSMNIDGFLQRAHSAIARIDRMLDRVCETQERVNGLLKRLAEHPLLNLRFGATYALDEFVESQTESIRMNISSVDKISMEAERAVAEMLRWVESTPLSSGEQVPRGPEAEAFERKQAGLATDAVRTCVLGALGLLRQRIGTRFGNDEKATRLLEPLFAVEVELTIPNVTINPSLEEIQRAVDSVVQVVVQSARSVVSWGSRVISLPQLIPIDVLEEASNELRAVVVNQKESERKAVRARIRAKVHAMVKSRMRPVGGNERISPGPSRDISPRRDYTSRELSPRKSVTQTQAPSRRSERNELEDSATPSSTVSVTTSVPHPPVGNMHTAVTNGSAVARSVIVMSKCIESMKERVSQYMTTFSHYNYLWQSNMHTAYTDFVASNPNVQRFEDQINKYVAVELSILDIPLIHSIGPLSLSTQSLKYSLKSEAVSWKEQYAKNLHLTGQRDLMSLSEYMRVTHVRLKQDVKDMEDLRSVMEVLQELRGAEAEMDAKFAVVEDIYAVLFKYGVRVSKEQSTEVAELRDNWRKLLQTGTNVAASLGSIQADYRRRLQENISAFTLDVLQFRNDYDLSGPMRSGLLPHEAIAQLRKFQLILSNLDATLERYERGEDLFGMPHQDYADLRAIKQEMMWLDQLYALYTDVDASVREFSDSYWVVLNVDTMDQRLAVFKSTLYEKMPRDVREWQIYQELKARIVQWLDLTPLLRLLTAKCVRSRHWVRIMQLTGITFNLAADSFKVKHLLDIGLLDVRLAKQRHGVIDQVARAAAKEQELEIKLGTIEETWSDRSLQFEEDFRGREGAMILKESDVRETLDLLEESQATLASMSTSRYIEPFRDEVASWQDRLAVVEDRIESWTAIQAMWIYLSTVYLSPATARQMPLEAARFVKLDARWARLMRRAYETANVVECCTSSEILKSYLPHLKTELEICQHALKEYLLAKRNAFPRFFFVPDSVLLEMLSEVNNPKEIAPHLHFIFDNVKWITLDKTDSRRILSLVSAEGEVLELKGGVMATGGLEEWVSNLVHASQTAVRRLARDAAREVFALDLKDFVAKYPSQIAVLGAQMVWTAEAESAVKRAKSEERSKASDKQVTTVSLKRITTDLEAFRTIASQEGLDTVERLKLETLISIQVRLKDAFEEIVRRKPKDLFDFAWLRHLRVYWDDAIDECILSIGSTSLHYGFEWLGCHSRLAITPLTARAYASLIQALSLGSVGALEGPSGTGKTETVKDVARTMGRFIVTFNCIANQRINELKSALRGVAQSGTWLCLDELDRVPPTVLSLVAEELRTILNGLRANAASVTTSDGQTFSVTPSMGIFTTLTNNVTRKMHIPESLRSLLRPTAMVKPDTEVLVRMRLTSLGLGTEGIFAQKLTALFSACSEQFSGLEWGLRHISAILDGAASRRRANLKVPDLVHIVETVVDLSTPRLPVKEVPLFLGLVRDVFGPVDVTARRAWPGLEDAIKTDMRSSNLSDSPELVEKCLQLATLSSIWPGVIVTGESGAGKSTVIDILCRALTAQGHMQRAVRMFPAAIRGENFIGGFGTTSTGDWSDWHLPLAWRRAARIPSVRTWLWLDGPLDGAWADSLLAVLDDSHVLALESGDRLALPPNVSLVMETDSLAGVSPSILSRTGIVHVGGNVAGWPLVVKSWLAQQKPFLTKQLKVLFDTHLLPAFQFIERSCSPIALGSREAQVRSCCAMLSGLLASLDDDMPQIETHTERSFLFAMMWSVGACLTSQVDRAAFTKHLSTLSERLPAMQSGETLADYCLDDDPNSSWEHWRGRCTDVRPVTGVPSIDGYIATPDSVRIDHVLGLLHGRKEISAAVLVGDHGVGKRMGIDYMLGSRRHKEDAPYSRRLHLTAASTSTSTQRVIESFLERRAGSRYGPNGGALTLTIILDGIAQAQRQSGTGELLRTLMEVQGMWSLDKPGDWKAVDGVSFLGIMHAPGGAYPQLWPRMRRHVALVGVSMPSTESLQTLCAALVANHFAASPQIMKVAEKLVQMTVGVWSKTRDSCLPVPGSGHYSFNLRDIVRIIEGMARINSAELTNATKVYALWKHEVQRTLGDRMTTTDATKALGVAISAAIKEKESAMLAQSLTAETCFVNFMRDLPFDESAPSPDFGPATGSPKVKPIHIDFQYAQQDGGIGATKTRVQQLITYHNAMNPASPLDVVLFDEPLCRVAQLTRLLAQPGASCILLGAGGPGRTSLTRLAAFIVGLPLLTVPAGGVEPFQEFIRGVVKRTAIDDQRVVVIIDEADVAAIGESHIMPFLDAFFASGDIPGLLTRDEFLDFQSTLVSAYRSAYPGAAEAGADLLHAFFVSRLRSNLHIVTCLSSSKMPMRLATYSNVVGRASVIWFGPWDSKALQAAARERLADLDLHGLVDKVAKYLAEVHQAVTDNVDEYATRMHVPVGINDRHFVATLEVFRNAYRSRRDKLGRHERLLTATLQRLHTASEELVNLQHRLNDENAALMANQTLLSTLLGRITDSSVRLERKRAEIGERRTELVARANRVEADRLAANAELAATQPGIDAANAALGYISPADIAQLRAMNAPPEIVKRVLDCLLIILPPRPHPSEIDKPGLGTRIADVTPSGLGDSWPVAQQLLSESGFVSRILHFANSAADRFTDEMADLIEPYLALSEMNMRNVSKSSKNAATLFGWVAALHDYHSQARVIRPKIRAIMATQKTIRGEIRKVDDEERELLANQQDRDLVQKTYDDELLRRHGMLESRDALVRLIAQFSGVLAHIQPLKQQWETELRALPTTHDFLVGDTLVAAASVCHLSFLPALVREEIHANTLAGKPLAMSDLPISTNHRTTTSLLDDVALGRLATEQLSSHEHMREGATAVLCAVELGVSRHVGWPLLFDPQGLAYQWILDREKDAGLVELDANGPRFRSELEASLSAGTPVVLSNVSPSSLSLLSPLLTKAFVAAGQDAFRVRLGTHDVEVGANFRLYLISRNPEYPDEIAPHTWPVDFSSTTQLAAELLLARVVQYERPELEARRLAFSTDLSTARSQLTALEDQILTQLAQSSGHMAEDTKLLTSLDNCFNTKRELLERCRVAELAVTELNNSRAIYAPISDRGALLYTIGTDLAALSPLYAISLDRFLQLFDYALEKSPAAPLPQKRVMNVLAFLVTFVWQVISRGMTVRHKNFLTLLLALRIDIADGGAADDEVYFLMRFGTEPLQKRVAPPMLRTASAVLNDRRLVRSSSAMDMRRGITQAPPTPPTTPVSEQVMARAIAAAKEVSTMGNLPTLLNLPEKEKEWKDWVGQPFPDDIAPPWEGALTKIQRLILIFVIRPDRFATCAASYSRAILGKQFDSQPPFDVSCALQAPDTTPCLLLVSSGGNPLPHLEHFARQEGRPLRCVALGPDGAEQAAEAVTSAGLAGRWLVLENCHLGGRVDEAVRRALAGRQAMDGFRLWMITSSGLSLTLYQASVKMWCESAAPTSLRSALLGALNLIDAGTLEHHDTPEWPVLVYGMVFLHCILVERGKYGSFGWSDPPVFSHEDLFTAIMGVNVFLNNQEMRANGIPWAAIRNFLADSVYGGHLGDHADKRVARVYVEKFIRSDMLSENFTFDLFDKRPQNAPAYTLPPMLDIASMRAHAENLPSSSDPPQTFGLHSGAEVLLRNRQAENLSRTLQAMLPPDAPSALWPTGCITAEEAAIANCAATIGNLPEIETSETIAERYNRMGDGPLTAALQAEVLQMHTIIRKVQASIASLQRVNAGRESPSMHTIETLTALSEGRVPTQWAAFSWSAPSLYSWHGLFTRKYDNLQTWVTREKLPVSMWLGGLFSPRSLLLALRQKAVHEIGDGTTSLDLVTIALDVSVKDRDQAVDFKGVGLYLHSAVLEGAAWDRSTGKLTDAPPRIPSSPMPLLALTASRDQDKLQDSSVYKCPVYYSNERGSANLVCYLNLPCTDAPEKWALRGVAVIV